MTTKSRLHHMPQTNNRSSRKYSIGRQPPQNESQDASSMSGGALWGFIIFLINLTAILWGYRSTNSSRGVFYEGDCTRVERVNSALHALINILSTILLAGSNYCMQILSAPTREDIDRSHSHASPKWLHIGVPSVRNLAHVGRRRAVLWCLLGVSSLPQHLL
jgi:hypothetical protein